ncbi:MAG TPA: DUF4179 domain-containing protein [Bacillus bacterium]|nr:DUF4179 domain-containing protein [Bacillus sp. (in: firmicutes)]
MNNIEKRLAEEKERIDSITAPEEVEMRLSRALKKIPPKRKKLIAPILKIAVALFFVAIISYQYNALAFYGKKLIGFDEVMTGTLQQLNEEGKGQIVEKKIVLEDGTNFIINGIMTDANQLVMYYTVANPKGVDYFSSDPFSGSRITGFLTNSNRGGGWASINENQAEIKGTMSFDPVSPFSKKLTFHYWQHQQNGQMKEESVTFPYNPNKAMQTEVKQRIKKTLKVDKGTITFDSITATPTMTVIAGTLNVKNFDRVHSALFGVELIANGVPVETLGSGSSSSFMGTRFDIRYDRLPKPLKSLELVMKEFVGYQVLGEKIPLISAGTDERIALNGKELWVKDVSATSRGVEITIATDQDVMLDGVSIEIQNESIPLTTTVNQNLIKKENGQELKERTLLFDTKEKPEYLLIRGMHYMKQYNKKIVIPVS